MSQDPVFVNLGVDRRTQQALADPQLLHSYAYSRNNPLIIKDDDGEFANVVIGAGGATAGQYIYDVYQNVQADGVSARAFYSDLSSGKTYLTRAGQGAAFAATGGVVGAARIGLVAQMGVMGGVGSAIGATGDRLLGEQITAQSLVWDAAFGASTFGLGSFVPKVRGVQPKFGTKAFFTGRHTLQHSQELVVDAGANYLNSRAGEFTGPSRSFSYNRSGGGGDAPAGEFGLSGSSNITGDNVGAFIGFISQLLT